MPKTTSATGFTRHVPVLLEGILSNLSEVNGPFLDLTIDGGGYAETFIKLFLDDKKEYYGLDRDPAAIERSRRRLAAFGERVRMERGNFAEVGTIFADIKGEVANVFIDLGLSSDQLEEGERGFSFRKDGPLDMRMSADSNGSETAADIVNRTPEDELADIIYEYGEERNSRRIAAA